MKKNLFSVILLAAGVSSRYWPLHEKYGFGFFGNSLLARQVDTIETLQPEKIVVVVNETNESLVRESLASKQKNIIMVRQQGEGQAAAIVAASAVVEGAAMILNTSDVYEEKLLLGIIQEWEKEQCIIISVKKVTEYFPGGYVALQSDGTVGKIVEKPGSGNEPSNLVRLVAEVVPSLKELAGEYDVHDDSAEGEVALFNKLFKKGVRGISLPASGYWVPIKYPWHVLDVMDVLLETLPPHQGKNVEIRSNVVIEGNVAFGDNVKVYENTKIVGPCYIGDNTIIGNNSIIRHSHIGAGCVTGFNTDITRSYIGDNCWFHSNYIGDSVLEGDVSMGSGTVLANLRLDRGEIVSVVGKNRANTKRTKLGAIIGKNVRFGVNTSIMPGVKIGSNSMVGAGLVVSRDIPDASKKLL